MKIKYYIITALLSLLNINEFNAQIEINKPIIFTSLDDLNNTIENITTTSNVDLLSAKEVIENKYQYAVVTIISDTIFASFSPKFEALKIGLKLYIQFPSNTINGVKYLKIDDQTKQMIFFNNSIPIGKDDIGNNQSYSVIYDGNAFQMLSSLNNLRDCPSGFVEINQQYCVSQFREGPGTFKESYKNCSNKGAKLCSWAEWYYACKNNSGLITDMNISGNEWVETGGNNANSAKVVGNNSCVSHGFADILNNTFYYRCCFTKKK